MAVTAELPRHTQVVVVGAGYAGLSAALRLRDQGVDVLVLEGAGRVGGRAHSEQHGSVVLDHGGQWVGPTQHRLLDWAERFNCRTFRTWNTGEHLELWTDGSPRRYTGAGPDDGPGLREYLATADRLTQLAAHIRLDDPPGTEHLTRLDGETVQAFLDRTVSTPAARQRMALAVQGVWACEPRELSLFHLLFYVAAAGGFDQLMDTEGGAQERRFTAGAQAPAHAAAAQLGPALRLDTRVLGVTQAGPQARVHTDAGTVRAERVVVALPPPAAAALTFTPQLPAARRRWLHGSPMGSVAKVNLTYPEPFWRAAGLSGQATLYGSHPPGVVFDNSPEDAGTGVLTAFVYGDRLRRWQQAGASARAAALRAALRTLFGPEAEQCTGYLEKNWNTDPWAGGGYAAVPSPGTWSASGTTGWRAPHGLVHWAGTETSTVWNGYLEGAIASGERAAREVLHALHNGG